MMIEQKKCNRSENIQCGIIALTLVCIFVSVFNFVQINIGKHVMSYFVLLRQNISLHLATLTKW